MTIPIHSINIFDRPKIGSHFILRRPVLNYKHTITAMGGFDTASCDIAVRSQTEGQDFLNNYLGCFVKCYADNPAEPIWEGLINRITFNSGDTSFTIGLDKMSNRVTVQYANDSVSANGAGTNSTTTTANNTTSQGIYGIKQTQQDFGYNRNGNAASPNALRDTILANQAFPQTSITQGGGNTNLVTLELIGIFHTLEWETVNYVSTATTNVDVLITATILPALGNGTTFFDNTDFSQIATRATATTGTQRSQTYWEFIMKAAELGDASHYWIAGITPTDPVKGTRVLYYKQVNGSTLYTARQRDGLRIRNLYGQLIPPWTVRPDNTVFVSDVLVGYNTAIQVDPRQTYIFTINYDANTQKVTYQGSDDLTAQGAWMLRRGYRPVGKMYGSTIRQTAN